MEKIDTFARIVELAVAIVGSAIITRIITIRQRVRQAKSDADKAEAEVKADQIENIRKTMDEVYKPIIDDLKRQVSELRDEVREVREENNRLKDENDELRDAIRELAPDAVPSRRSINAKNQRRNPDGTFAKEVRGDYDKQEGGDGYDK